MVTALPPGTHIQPNYTQLLKFLFMTEDSMNHCRELADNMLSKVKGFLRALCYSASQSPNSNNSELNMRFKISLFLSAFLALEAAAATRYVNPDNANPVWPHASWASAALTIQEAVDAAADGETILVTNGVYQTGARAVFNDGGNRVAVTNAVHLLSVNGPAVTFIDGGNSNRCVYLGSGAQISGFTLTNGNGFAQEGGGVYSEYGGAIISNCLLVANVANWGGGAYRGRLIDCTLAGNSASEEGGGCFLSDLKHCL